MGLEDIRSRTSTPIRSPIAKNFIEDPTFDPSAPKRCLFPLWDSEERQEKVSMFLRAQGGKRRRAGQGLGHSPSSDPKLEGRLPPVPSLGQGRPRQLHPRSVLFPLGL